MKTEEINLPASPSPPDLSMDDYTQDEKIIIGDFFIKSAGLVFCKSKFFNSCSEIFQERSKILDLILNRNKEDAMSRIISLLEGNSLSENGKWYRYRKKLDDKAVEIYNFFKEEGLENNPQSGYAASCRHFKHLGRRYKELKEDFEKGDVTHLKLKEFIDIEYKIYDVLKELDKVMTKRCRSASTALKPIDGKFKKTYATFLADTYGLLSNISLGAFSSLFSSTSKWRNVRKSITDEVNKEISQGGGQIRYEYIMKLIQDNKDILKQKSKPYNEELDRRLSEVVNDYITKYDERDFEAKYYETCYEIWLNYRKIQKQIENIKELSVTDSDNIPIKFLKNFDKVFMESLDDLNKTDNDRRHCFFKTIYEIPSPSPRLRPGSLDTSDSESTSEREPFFSAKERVDKRISERVDEREFDQSPLPSEDSDIRAPSPRLFRPKISSSSKEETRSFVPKVSGFTKKQEIIPRKRDEREDVSPNPQAPKRIVKKIIPSKEATFTPIKKERTIDR